MRILIAPNAFKNSLSADGAAAAIEAGLVGSGLKCECEKFPVADGGDGTASLLIEHFKAKRIYTMVLDPLGREIEASIGWVEKDQIAIIEMADASGLRLLKKEEYDPLHSSSFGTGQLVRLATELGAKKILLGIGGTATVDGGLGALCALGFSIQDKAGGNAQFIPSQYSTWNSIDISQLQKHPEIVILSDVRNFLLGEGGAAKVFGPQKGATAGDIVTLENALGRLHELVLANTGMDMSRVERGGAAGGIAAAFAVLMNAKLVNGIDFFLDNTSFDGSLTKADLVITGEGRIDDQTMEGKAPFGVALRAKQKDIPVIGMAGQVAFNLDERLKKYFAKLISINKPGESLDTSIANTEVNLKTAAQKLGDWLKQHSM